MLFFLALAMRKNFIVDAYTDRPSGVIDRNAAGKKAFVTITMRPEATFSGDTLPTREDIDTLHARAHSLCFVANSLNAEITIESVYPAE
jgi:organic hydroperoxide reductase OsmC/OhrA